MARSLAPETAASIERMRQRWYGLPQKLADGVISRTLDAAVEIAESMRAIAPEGETGELSRSIEVTGPNRMPPEGVAADGMAKTGPRQILITAGNTRAYYAAWVEHGTVNAEAQPFFWPPWRARRVWLRGQLARAFSQAMRAASQGQSDG